MQTLYKQKYRKKTNLSSRQKFSDQSTVLPLQTAIKSFVEAKLTDRQASTSQSQLDQSEKPQIQNNPYSNKRKNDKEYQNQPPSKLNRQHGTINSDLRNSLNKYLKKPIDINESQIQTRNEHQCHDNLKKNHNYQSSTERLKDISALNEKGKKNTLSFLHYNRVQRLAQSCETKDFTITCRSETDKIRQEDKNLETTGINQGKYERFQIIDIKNKNKKSSWMGVNSIKQSYRVFWQKVCGGWVPLYENQEMKIIELENLRILCINCDMNVIKENTNWRKKVYVGVKDQISRRRQIIKVIRSAIKEGTDFIFIQEANTKEIRQQILQLVNQVTSDDETRYYYPQNLKNQSQLIGTLILSKHKVRFGRMNFIIEDPISKICLDRMTSQSFCEFQVKINGKQQKICLYNCHWLSSRKIKLEGFSLNPVKVRQIQRLCTHQFGVNQQYKMLLVIGDTNMKNDQTLLGDPYFHDTYKPGQKKYKGTYWFVNQFDQIIEQKLDRVLVNNGSKNIVNVKVSTWQQKLLECIKDQRNPKQVLVMNKKQLNYMHITDHTILNIRIKLKKGKW